MTQIQKISNGKYKTINQNDINRYLKSYIIVFYGIFRYRELDTTADLGTEAVRPRSPNAVVSSSRG